MSIFQVPNINLAGISACVPEKIFSNHDYDWISEKEREVLIKTIGVSKKHHAKKGLTTSDLCYVAADRLLNELEWDRSDIDLLVFVSQSRDYIIPATAGLLQDKLGLSKSCIAFDVSLGCSGYVYGLSIVGSLMNNGAAKKALLLTGDISTLNTSYKDKSAYPIFGDAGTATALEFKHGHSPMLFNLQTDGNGYDAIIIPDGGIRNFVDAESLNYKKISEGIYRNNLNIILDGVKVFNFSLREVKPNVLALLQNGDIEIMDIDYFVFHQANRLMNETIRKQLKIPPEKVPYSLKNYGNTSSASIPLTIVAEISNMVKNKSKTLLLSGFGVGLSWGSVIVETENVTCPPILIYKG
ncbi:MAG: ketoacyl-ACP synthase III [Bacteroidales bacterium]|jgi:3-oxoacyl-[acyl-carrier-protein] synthase III|nr:3-oxoacyl-ACP synthase [Lentimicrobiaceae bacterium]MDG1136491.1 ketoacyl-ACP synthase III [Bacteroidales bacterium]MDG1902128.1 ketoacyl-ACP synthase III [Bacteroidales bacterium]MDG2082003.1 ketoacyl-ACP synthase III [Bacteroidales bacterium]|tara:strand:+ start:554 stop:1615 length:1062 start_codon:yes stop_codon:yes gene_type:complete